MAQGCLVSPSLERDTHLPFYREEAHRREIRPSAVQAGALPLARGEMNRSSALCPKLEGHNWGLSSIGPRSGLTHSLLEGEMTKWQES